MIAKLGLIAAAPFVVTGMLFGVTGVVLVDVKEGQPDGTHIVVPVPLILAQTAMTFAPDEAKYVDCPQFARYQKVALTVLDELEQAPDGVLVEARDGAESVIIRKEGKLLRINVEDGGGESVECNLPIRSARRAVEAYDGHGFPTKAAFWALRRAPRGTLVHVKDSHDEITIRLL